MKRIPYQGRIPIFVSSIAGIIYIIKPDILHMSRSEGLLAGLLLISISGLILLACLYDDAIKRLNQFKTYYREGNSFKKINKE